MSVRYCSVNDAEYGAVLIVVSFVLVVLSVLGIEALNATNVQLQSARNDKLKKESFYAAESGVSYAIKRMQDKIETHDFALPATNSSTDLNATHPDGIDFVISDIINHSGSFYTLNSTGYSSDCPQCAQTTIKVYFVSEPKPVVNFAAFGDTQLDAKNSGSTLSYNSQSANASISDPQSASFNSTGQAHVGSNDHLVTHKDTFIDGNLVIGECDDGTNGTNDINSKTNSTGEVIDDTGRIDPDPLGISPYKEYDPGQYYLSNDNNDLSIDDADTVDESDAVSLGNNKTLTLSGKSGGAVYYFTSVELNNGSTLNIDVTNGPVSIYMTGDFIAKNGSQIQVVDNGTATMDATKFSIFSNTIGNMEFKHGSAFTGFVYAPYATITVKNSGNVYGALWGNSVEIKNSGTVYFDTALMDAHPSSKYVKLKLTGWQEE